MENNVSNENSYFKYTKEDVVANRAFPRLKAAFFQLCAIEVVAGTHEETDNATLAFTFAPMNSEGRPDREVWVKNTITISLPNPKVPGHKCTSQWANTSNEKFKKSQNSLGVQYVDALCPGYLPAKALGDGASGYRDANGNVITKAEKAAIDDKRLEMTFDKLGEWYSDPTLVRGAMTYGEVVHKAGTGANSDKIYTNLRYVTADPGDKEVVREDFSE